MTDPKKAILPSWSRVRGRIVACSLIVAGVLHALKPRWFAVDWPSIALIALGVLLLIIPLDELGGIVESLEIGKTKILFRKVRELDKSVKTAREAEEVSAIQVPLPDAATQKRVLEALKAAQELDLNALFTTDERMALIRIGIELEKMIAELVETTTGRLVHNPNWQQMLRQLESMKVISTETVQACLEFRDVRNQLIHPSGNPVPDAAVASAIDSGLNLLRIISGILKIHQTVQSPG